MLQETTAHELYVYETDELGLVPVWIPCPFVIVQDLVVICRQALPLCIYQVLQEETIHDHHEFQFQFCCPEPFVMLHVLVLTTHWLFSKCCSEVHVGIYNEHAFPFWT